MTGVPQNDELFTDPWFENSVPIVMPATAQVVIEPPRRWPLGETPYVRPHCPRMEMVPLAKP